MLHKLRETGVFWGCCLLSVALPFFMLPASYALAVLLVLWLWKGEFRQKWLRLKSALPFWLMAGFFVLHIAALAYTQDLSAGVSDLGKKLPLLALPLVIFSSSVSKREINSVFHFFGAAITVATVVLLLLFLIKLLQAEGACSNCYYHDFSDPLGLHAVYYSYYCFFAVLFYIGALRQPGKRSIQVLQLCCLVILGTGILLAASKLVLLACCLFVPAIIIYLLRQTTVAYTKAFGILLAVSLILVLSVSFLAPVRSRFVDALDFSSQHHYAIVGTDKQLSNNEKRELTGFTLRVLLWKLGLHELQQENRVMAGFGPGDATSQMNKVYMRHNMAPQWFEGYNMHNQYVQTLLELGVLGVLSLLLLLVLPLLYRQRVYSTYLLLAFTGLMAVAFVSEVVLGLNKGLVFFSFFYSLLNTKTS